MSKIVGNVAIFIAGAGVGSALTWKLVKDKYERIAQEEIDSVKEVFSRRYDEPKEVVESEPEETEEDKYSEEEHTEYINFVKSTGYTGGVELLEKGESVAMDKPYVITPGEFSESDYDTVSLTLYSDGILTDELDDIVVDVEGTVGYDSFNHFGEYEEDSVFVRNDRLEIDYEILRDLRSYEDVHSTHTEE